VKERERPENAITAPDTQAQQQQFKTGKKKNIMLMC